MQRLLLAYASGSRSDRILEQGMLLILLEKLVKSFTKPVQIGEQGDNDTSSQIAQIIQYIHANFKINMSLNEIAERLYISPSWASRVFRKETGEHLQANEKYGEFRSYTYDRFFNGLLKTFPLVEPRIRVSLFYRQV